MARPRRAAVDAHISGYTLPRFADADWEDLERIACVPLDDAAHAAIQVASDRYTEETLLQHDGAARAEMVGQGPAGRKQHKKAPPLATFRKALRQLVAAWRNADGDPETARLLSDFAAETEHRSKGTLDFERTLVDLETIANCLGLFLDRIEKGVVPIRGPSARKNPPARGKRPSLHDPFTPLVRRLAEIVEVAGGSVTAATLTEKSRRVSPFVAFMMRLNDCLPDGVRQRHASEAAWSKAVARALRA